MSGPRRIRLRRERGWRLPNGAVSVARPGRFGNPFRVGASIAQPDGKGDWWEAEITPDLAVALYRSWVELSDDAGARWIREHLEDLRGRDLACYCHEGDPCHADVLLELANRG